MKVRNISALLFLTALSYGQNVQVSAGVDIRNAITGSDATKGKSELDMMYQFAMVSNKGVEVGILYEEFKAISFERYGVQLGYQINVLDRVKIVPAINYNIIGRYGGNWGNASSHLAFGANIGLRYSISDSFDIEYNGELLNRVDLNTKYGGNNNIYSGQLKVIYKINL
jgi:hypothetical protein